MLTHWTLCLRHSPEEQCVLSVTQTVLDEYRAEAEAQNCLMTRDTLKENAVHMATGWVSSKAFHHLGVFKNPNPLTFETRSQSQPSQKATLAFVCWRLLCFFETGFVSVWTRPRSRVFFNHWICMLWSHDPAFRMGKNNRGTPLSQHGPVRGHWMTAEDVWVKNGHRR